MTYINDTESAGELARLDHQAGLVTEAIGLVPHELRKIQFKKILDIGCGSGRWALDVAYRYPDAEIVGIDISKTLVDYASARARTTQRNNLTFIQFDALQGKVGDLGTGSYDLINVRFAVGWVGGLDHWVQLIKRCRELNTPGGYTVITEGEGLYTSSAALLRLYEIIVQAFVRGGYGLSLSERDLGMARLGCLLSTGGFSEVSIEGGAIDFSFYQKAENMAWRNSFIALITECSTFFLKMGVTSAAELAELGVRVSAEMFEEHFSGVGSLFTFYGVRVK
ncbi:MAG: class I SAM-dependent methyltransferase [Ktedonobacteraceae bacterium]|nr:class I SAM-dependent methyltransferase [Ktedonobacteraceae bacterium]